MKKVFIFSLLSIAFVNSTFAVTMQAEIKHPTYSANEAMAAIPPESLQEITKLKANLVLAEEKFGKAHPIIANLLEEMGMAYQLSGFHEKARQQFRKALKINKALHPQPDHPNIIVLLNRMARSHFLERNYATADRYYLEAFMLLKNAIGPQHIESVSYLGNLANIYLNESLYQEAEPILINALALYNEYHSPSHPNVSPLLEGLKTVYLKTGQPDRAKAVQQEINRVHN